MSITPINRASVFCISALAAAAGGASHGQTMESGPALYAQMLTASDYRFDGVSLSNTRPAAQGGAVLAWPSSDYLGLWGSTVDFQDQPRTHYELDAFAGRSLAILGTKATLEAMYTFYPDKHAPGPTYNYLQIKLSDVIPLGRGTIGGSVAWSPAGSFGSGVNWRTEALTSYELSPGVSLDGSIGRRWVTSGHDRTFFSLGGSVTWRSVKLDLHYLGTNLSKSQCSYLDWCAAAVVAKATYAFAPIPLARR